MVPWLPAIQTQRYAEKSPLSTPPFRQALLPLLIEQAYPERTHNGRHVRLANGTISENPISITLLIIR
jgi:hypothetical protein